MISFSAKIPSHQGSGYGSGGYQGQESDDSQKKKKRLETLDLTTEDLKDMPYSAERAAWDKRSLRYEDISQQKETEVVDKKQIAEELSNLINAAAEDRAGFVESVNVLMGVLGSEIKERSVYARFILEAFSRYAKFFNSAQRVRLVNFLENMDFEVDDEGDAYLCDFLLRNIRSKGVEKGVSILLDGKIALITHASSGIQEDIQKLDNIDALFLESDLGAKAVFEKIKPFFAEIKGKYDAVYAILPNSVCWRVYSSLKQIANATKSNIIIVDSRTYGSGLAYLLRRVLLERTEVQDYRDFELTIKQKVSSVKYWVMPKNIKKLINQPWFVKLCERSNEQSIIDCPSQWIPILSLYKNIGIIAKENSVQAAIEKFGQSIVQSTAGWTKKPSKIFVEYQKELKYEAEELTNVLKSYYKKTNISFVETKNKALIKEFGAYVSVSMIL